MWWQQWRREETPLGGTSPNFTDGGVSDTEQLIPSSLIPSETNRPLPVLPSRLPAPSTSREGLIHSSTIFCTVDLVDVVDRRALSLELQGGWAGVEMKLVVRPPRAKKKTQEAGSDALVMRTSSGFEWFSSFGERSDKAMFRKWKFEYWWTIKCEVISWTTFNDLTELVLNKLQITGAGAVCCGFQMLQNTAVEQKKILIGFQGGVTFTLCLLSSNVTWPWGGNWQDVRVSVMIPVTFPRKVVKKRAPRLWFTQVFLPFSWTVISWQRQTASQANRKREKFWIPLSFFGFLPKWSSWFLSQADWHSHMLIIIKLMLPG